MLMIQRLCRVRIFLLQDQQNLLLTVGNQVHSVRV